MIFQGLLIGNMYLELWHLLHVKPHYIRKFIPDTDADKKIHVVPNWEWCFSSGDSSNCQNAPSVVFKQNVSVLTKFPLPRVATWQAIYEKAVPPMFALHCRSCSGPRSTATVVPVVCVIPRPSSLPLLREASLFGYLLAFWINGFILWVMRNQNWAKCVSSPNLLKVSHPQSFPGHEFNHFESKWFSSTAESNICTKFYRHSLQIKWNS